MADVQVLRLIDASFDELFRTQNSRDDVGEIGR